MSLRLFLVPLWTTETDRQCGALLEQVVCEPYGQFRRADHDFPFLSELQRASAVQF